MADVRPFRALRYSPAVDLSLAICPPFDVISPEEQKALHEQAPYNAVHIELAIPENSDPYQTAASNLRKWLEESVLRRDGRPAYYLYQQRFTYAGHTFTRRMLFARVRLQPWSEGVVLPHEQTFGAPKEDRLKLLRATNLQASPLFLIYRDRPGRINAVLSEAASAPPDVSFGSPDGQSHSLTLITDEPAVTALHDAFAAETLYIADGHHRYETLLGYRDEMRSKTPAWTGEEAANFAMAGMSAAADPGMLVLPIHRITAIGAPWNEVRKRLEPLFSIETAESVEAVTAALEGASHVFGLVAEGEPKPLVLRVADPDGVDALLPQDRSTAWRSLDYSIANHAIMGHALGLTEKQMTDYSSVWFSEDARQAEREVRDGRARYAVILNPISIESVLDLAEEGERMPQKSTFFYPKVPTGLLFNPLDS